MTFLQNIFSITNKESKDNKIYKVVTIFGIKFKVQNKYKTLLKMLDNEKQKNKVLSDKLKKELQYKLHRYCPDEKRELALKDWYFEKTGEQLDLESPQTFNEKIQWLKLNDSTPLKTRLADKYLVRDWVKEKIGEEYLIPLLGVWDKFDDINFDKLPNQFVLKCNHGCGYNIIVKDKSKLDLKDTKNKINKWMNEDFAFRAGFEMHYSAIPHKIIAEEYITEVDNTAIDYKFICCNGKPYLCWITNKSIKRHERSFYKLPEWEWQDIQYLDNGAILAETPLPKPHNLDKILDMCKILSKDFSLVRVDFYITKERVIFGELTFTSSSGVAKFSPDVWNYVLGDAISLPMKG